MPDVATLSADDVRRLVMNDYWCPKCQRIGCHVTEGHDLPKSLGGKGPEVVESEVESLFTRCPDCQPDGLEWGLKSETWEQHGWFLDSSRCALPVHTAIDLILMSIARSGTAVYNSDWRVSAGMPWMNVYSTLTTAIMTGDLPGAVAAMQRLLDLEDKT